MIAVGHAWATRHRTGMPMHALELVEGERDHYVVRCTFGRGVFQYNGRTGVVDCVNCLRLLAKEKVDAAPDRA